MPVSFNYILICDGLGIFLRIFCGINSQFFSYKIPTNFRVIPVYFRVPVGGYPGIKIPDFSGTRVRIFVPVNPLTYCHVASVTVNIWLG